MISDLYSSLADNLSFSEKWDLEDSIEAAERLAQEQWEVQKDLLEAQIEQIEAQTKKLQSGDALITVDGGNLTVELQAFMEAVFKNIKIHMNSDYQSYLLGISAP